MQNQDRNKSFSFDLAIIDINKIKLLIINKELFPARKILLENIDQRFYIIERMGIKNLKDLLFVLKTKSKIQAFSEISGIDTEYLTILKREAGSYIPKPIKFDKFPDIDSVISDRLKSIEIFTNKDLLELKYSKSVLNELSDSISVDVILLRKIYSLSDLSRIPGVGPVFANILLEAGISSLDDFRNTQPESILNKANEIIKKKKNIKARLTMKDIEYSKELSQFLV